MRKVTVIGSGNVGATVANVLAHKDLVNEIVLLDIQGDMAKGKALDISKSNRANFACLFLCVFARNNRFGLHTKSDS